MKHYHIFFLILKAIILLQFLLILLNKQTINSKIYIITEILFKISLGLFIEIFLFHNQIEGLLFEDKIIFSFAGGFLVYDAIINNLPELLKEFNKKK